MRLTTVATQMQQLLLGKRQNNKDGDGNDVFRLLLCMVSLFLSKSRYCFIPTYVKAFFFFPAVKADAQETTGSMSPKLFIDD